ncbi:MAG: hypothetical protein ACREIT_04525, partial [Tepidisphaeraceae bacterium]
DVFTAHPIAGVGWANFGYHYLGERLPEASEEIKDPHNLFVRAFVELGLMGGVLIIAWLTRTWWELTRPIAPAPSGAGAAKLVNTARPYSGLPLVATVSTVGIALSVLATVDWSVPMENLVIESFKRLLFLCAMVLGMTLVVLRSTDKQELDERPAPWVLYGILIGLGVFLVHNLIDFSLFEPGPMTLFAALAGAALGVRQPSHAGERKRTPLVIGATVLACAAWLGILIFLLVPVAEAEARAHAADDALRANHPGQAAGGFQAAYGAVLFNADYAFRVAQALSYHRAGPEQIRPWLARALETNPFAPEYYLTRARYELNLQPVDQQTVRADFESALRLNPNAVDIRLEYADILARFGPKQEAVAQYEKSMEYNRLLDPNEPKRLTSKKIEEVERAIAELK